jgi:prepilin-type processing-associated H-X9-DG protein
MCNVHQGQSRRRHRAVSGFSLAELLTVIGIIAILISILMPALAMVRERGNQLKCMASLRAIGQAAQLHVNEHNGYLPCAGWQWNTDGGLANPHGMGDDQARKYDYYTDEGERRPMPITAALGRYLGVTLHTNSRQALEQDLQADTIQRLFRCPSQQVTLSGWTERDTAGWQSPDEVSSYAFNEALLGRRDRSPSVSPFPVGQITTVRHPSQVFFACDGRTRDPQTDRCFLVFDFGPNDTLQDFNTKIQTSPQGKELIDPWRHRRRINVLFVDGHVDSFSTDAGDLAQIGVSRGIY